MITTTPKPIVIGPEWPDIGQLVHVRVKIAGDFCYTTRILKPGEKLIDLVMSTRRDFRMAQNGRV